ncbi:unnamed protein product [Nippostrongylus brasiliensis]|uniref:Uncharacterized protein n=1 Tax=Nippostrongylus brasiliensis TaxID=27835 RepID=A0A0N4YSK1_NIPBR|nr:unnamed protein product [Nippostrongylus brasiliensis]
MVVGRKIASFWNVRWRGEAVKAVLKDEECSCPSNYHRRAPTHPRLSDVLRPDNPGADMRTYVNISCRRNASAKCNVDAEKEEYYLFLSDDDDEAHLMNYRV